MKYVDTMNRPRTESLFVETVRPEIAEKFPPVYTMRSSDRDGCKSAYQIYMNSVNEYDAAMKIVGDMRHWRRLCGLKWFMEGSDEKAFDGLRQWREDKAMKDQAELVTLLKEQAENGNVNAQKTLYDITVGKDKKTGVGRPKKPVDSSVADERSSKIVELHKQLRAEGKL